MNTQTVTVKGQSIIVTVTPVNATRANFTATFKDGRVVRDYDTPSLPFEIEADIDSDVVDMLDHYAYIF